MDNRRHSAGKKVEAVISSHEGPLLRYAMMLLGNSEAVQDAVEEAFVKVLVDPAEAAGMPDGSLSIRLYRAVSAAVSSRFAKQGRLKRGAPAEMPAPAEAALNAVRTLDFAEQNVVILKIFEGKNNEEISHITGLGKDCVDEMLRRSIIKTAEELKKAGLL